MKGATQNLRVSSTSLWDKSTNIVHGKNYQDFNSPKSSPYRASHVFDVENERIQVEQCIKMLNKEQKAAFDKIMSAIDDCKSCDCFFPDGPWGSGNTFVYNVLMSALRVRDEIVIPVASTGIAATLLAGGRIYHSKFKLTIPLKENSTLNVRPNSEDAKILKKPH